MSNSINSIIPNRTYKKKGVNVSLSNSYVLPFLISTTLFSIPSWADEYHYNNILIGDRAAGMGGAYTAISDDPSGLYYNPAGIVFAQGNNISVSANALHQTKTVYKNALGGNDYVRRSSALLPNFFGIIQPFGKGKIGFSYAVPDSVIEDQDQIFYNIPGTTTSQYNVNFNKSDSTYNFGPSYALELKKDLSLGVTLYAHYRRNEWRLNQLINKSSGGTYQWTNQFYDNTEWGVKPIIGMMWSPTNKISTGLSISNVYVLRSNTTYQSMCAGDIPGICDPSYLTGTAPFQELSKFTYRRHYPLTATLGVAYFKSKALLFSGDASFYSSVHDDYFGYRRSLWNYSFGAEYYLTEKWAIKGGVFSDKSNTQVIHNGDSNALDHVNLYGGSLSATYFTRQSSVTVGGTFKYGKGKAQILGNSATQEVVSQSSTLFLSGSYFY